MSLAYRAERNIDRKGEPLTLRQTTPGAYDPTTRTYPSAATTDTAFTGFVAEYDADQVDGSTVLRGDLQCWVSDESMTVTPAVGDLVIRSGTAYRIERTSQPAGPGRVTVLQIRGTE